MKPEINAFLRLTDPEIFALYGYIQDLMEIRYDKEHFHYAIWAFENGAYNTRHPNYYLYLLRDCETFKHMWE